MLSRYCTAIEYILLCHCWELGSKNCSWFLARKGGGGGWGSESLSLGRLHRLNGHQRQVVIPHVDVACGPLSPCYSQTRQVTSFAIALPSPPLFSIYMMQAHGVLELLLARNTVVLDVGQQTLGACHTSCRWKQVASWSALATCMSMCSVAVPWNEASSMEARSKHRSSPIDYSDQRQAPSTGLKQQAWGSWFSTNLEATWQ